MESEERLQRERRLLATVKTNRDDSATLLNLADWLDAHGDQRGPWVRKHTQIRAKWVGYRNVDGLTRRIRKRLAYLDNKFDYEFYEYMKEPLNVKRV